jgi:4-amino-4-deoxy-L-arabinose transferase-like glycosyltransferase
MLKNLQLGVGFLIGFFAALILAIGVIAGIEAIIDKPLPFKIALTLTLAFTSGVIAARWIGSFDLSRFVTAREPKPVEPKPPKPPRKRRPWSFYLVGTLILFWFLSLVMIIVLFGPFGFADDPSLTVRLLKIAACTVAIAGMGGFLLRKEFAKLMSASQK